MPEFRKKAEAARDFMSGSWGDIWFSGQLTLTIYEKLAKSTPSFEVPEEVLV